MESAFGIEHGISKSLVNGSWKKASQLSGAERKAVGGYRKLKGVKPEDEKFKEHHHAQLTAQEQLDAAHRESPGTIRLSEHKTKGGKAKAYTIDGPISGMPDGLRGFHVRTGSKSHGQSTIVVRGKGQLTLDRSNPEHTLTHELGHADAKRSSYRFHQMADDSKKTIKEEARADARLGHYASTPENTSAYANASRQRQQRQFKNHGIQALRSTGAEKYTRLTPKDTDEYHKVHDAIHGKQRVPGSHPVQIVGRKTANAFLEHPGATAATIGAPAVAVNVHQNGWDGKKRKNAKR